MKEPKCSKMGYRTNPKMWFKQFGLKENCFDLMKTFWGSSNFLEPFLMDQERTSSLNLLKMFWKTKKQKIMFLINQKWFQITFSNHFWFCISFLKPSLVPWRTLEGSTEDILRTRNGSFMDLKFHGFKVKWVITLFTLAQILNPNDDTHSTSFFSVHL